MTFSDESKNILYEVRGKIAIIQLNIPKSLNSLTGPQYLYLGQLVQRADADPNTLITLLCSSGRYFSAGANVKNEGFENQSGAKDGDENFLDTTALWMSNFTARNVWLTQLFLNHSKITVCAMNGPAVGLSAAIVAMCDLIYGMNDSVFLLTPFASLGLVCEGATSVSLFQRLGISKANEALIFSKPVLSKDLYRLGFLNELYDFKDTDQFNKKIVDDLEKQMVNLNPNSMLEIKASVRATYQKNFEVGNVREAVLGLQKWVAGIPQARFTELYKGSFKHKL
ncbi:unnamed protein product [Kuraishia capsulata CBS 1993]|uniref:Uncharacterized protein n=1 Tax=Kuraishia capsulata CBS 1993 TaxID=1382522 RepID=W6MKP8_9ASCO|nr:uncharacterized protein KUCA_T00002571001 [Kuraishia capsulata CBS 1993]CDK26598.1 unnamed protein product [Kuraishia capsulata CBS 1993]